MWEAGFWGLIGGSALILGAGVGYAVSLPQRVIAAVMAIGSGVLISAVAFDLMDEAFRQGGFDSTAAGFLGGAIVYTIANIAISRNGARHSKRSGSNDEESQPAGGLRSERDATPLVPFTLPLSPGDYDIGEALLLGAVLSV